ncbi:MULTISPECIES: multidrug ABC transporter permease/ATP-binding protein [Marinomonas]|uniref:Multidrug ABC transporter permease/ATP-binding protein n=1 Tax=Marinomonas arctica TaxID=383750 RepID=A0A7H1J6R2_9GAMM|nr:MULTISPECIES: multidrug ABC transporter permease/ATP-binding protein [Marinomonas]MCS7485152.1 multidrug transporter membrane component/ATP-binding component [Marinomonas sp. BSi20414]QNT06178.1 multidrug ABC transporter permease/ATP-binding protein [Marinomonas arctica]GGN18203.1 ABC transporter ATP-binding protein [Marinomonas arctica]
MNLLIQLADKQGKSLILVILLSMASALLTVGVIAFIQYKLLNQQDLTSSVLWQFVTLLIVLLVTASVAQIALHKLGHQFVYKKRCQLIKKLINTDIEQVESIGSARLLASLSTDIRNVTFAFVHLPELIYGVVLCIIALCYLAFLSLPLFGVSILLLSLTGLFGFGLVSKITHHIKQVREYDDKLYQDYQSFIEGRKEISLNPGRAKRYFNDEFNQNAKHYRDQVTRADILNGFAGNMANTIVLALIGLNYYLALGLGWASFGVASSFALIILFMRTPLMSAVGSLPTLVTANISMQKLEALSLSQNESLIEQQEVSLPFEKLNLQQVVYQYRPDGDDKPFQVGPIDFSIKQGETVFIIGGNGSGKSTFANLLTGLYRPHSGQVFLNNQPVSLEKWHEYRLQFSAVFSDFYLFHQITDGHGDNVNDAEIDEWMTRLEMAHKVSHQAGHLSDTRYSQGQRKRLALLMAVMEKRGCILLDEWAADQDPKFRKTFYRELLPLLKERGVTIIAITHDDKYFDAADRVFKMDLGQLTELNTDDQSHAQDALSSIVF